VKLYRFQKLKELKFLKIEGEERSVFQKVLYGTCWLLATSRNLLVVLISTSVAYALEYKGSAPFRLTGENILIPSYSQKTSLVYQQNLAMTV